MISPRLFAQRAQSEVLVRLARRRGVDVAATARFIAAPIVSRAPESTLTIGERVRLVSDSRRTALGVDHPVVLRTLLPGAVLTIAEDVGISGGSICSASRVEIGAGSMLGANVIVADTDFHPIANLWRRYEAIPVPKETDQVLIGRNVFIGTSAVILKGTRIGDNCVIGAGAVVKGHFADGSVIAGNPARVISNLEFTPTR